MKFPSYGIEEADKGGFADSAFEEWVGGQGAEGIVADFGISRRCSSSYEVQIAISRYGRGVEQYQPDVYPRLRLDNLESESPSVQRRH